MKEKFRTHIGTAVDYQTLVLRRQGIEVYELSDNCRMLGFYSVESGDEIHVIDSDPFSLSRGGGLTDTSLVQKYKMSEEAYDQRKGTLREFIREKKRADPNYKLPCSSNPVVKTTQSGQGEFSVGSTAVPIDAESVKGIKVGNRCETNPGGRRGTVMFVGEIAESKSGGYWVGVRFDEPVGLGNGTHKGKVIFECPENYGSFLRGHNVSTGDFPERDLFADSDDENDDGNDATKGTEAQDEDEI